MRVLLPLSLVLFAASCAPASEETPDGFAPAASLNDGDIEAAARNHLAAFDGDDLSEQADALRGLQLAKVSVDDLLQRHVRFAQAYDGVRVFGGEVVVHFDADGTVLGATDDRLPDVAVDTTPALDADTAIELAVQAVLPDGWAGVTDDPQVELVIVRRDGADHLAWKVQLQRLPGDAADTMPMVFVDAHEGAVVWAFENLQSLTCSGGTNYYGTVSFDCYTDGSLYYLEDSAEKLATYSWLGGSRTLSSITSTGTAFNTAGSVYTKNAVEAHWVQQQVYSYYVGVHGRNGIDGAGGPAATTSHGTGFITSGTSYSTRYVNAYWDGSKMTYGDGDGVNATSLTSLDIGGHEMAHGVTQYEANLTYSGESGHLNESMSDVFGAMVERYVQGDSADIWKIGEDAWTPATAGDALRYMNDPAADGASYDFSSGTIGSVDVHYGSGVPNLAFYLLSAGGTHPRGKSTQVVTGIGADDAADIWYLALSNYMTASTNFAGARAATLSAASALFGATSQQYTSVGQAWTAVGVGASGGGGSTGCTTTNYTGSITRAGRSVYAPSSSGSSAAAGTHTISLTGPTAANFDLYLQKASGRSWSTVASGTSSTSTESLTYAGTSGTYRAVATSRTGTGSFTVGWCKP